LEETRRTVTESLITKREAAASYSSLVAKWCAEELLIKDARTEYSTIWA
jgi:hypothetical protein